VPLILWGFVPFVPIVGLALDHALRGSIWTAGLDPGIPLVVAKAAREAVATESDATKRSAFAHILSAAKYPRASAFVASGAGRAHVGFSAQTGDSGISASFSSYVNGKVSGLGAQGSAWVQSNTGVDASNPRVAAGASAAATLVSNGFDPTSASDRQAMVSVIAGGLCLIPGVGPILGSALEVLYQIAQPLACPTAKLFHTLGISASDCDSPPCSYQGPAPTAETIQNNFDKPVTLHFPGSFGQITWGALCTNAASAMACKSSVPYDVVVDAVVAMWNATRQGPAADIYVPPLGIAPDGMSPTLPIVPTWDQGSGGYWSQTGGVDPNVYYAFFPMVMTPWQTLSAAPPGPGQKNVLGSYSPARTVSVNTGVLVSTAPAPRAGTRYVPGLAHLTTTAPAAFTQWNLAQWVSYYLPGQAVTVAD
jgi:hypothetical protein